MLVAHLFTAAAEGFATHLRLLTTEHEVVQTATVASQSVEWPSSLYIRCGLVITNLLPDYFDGLQLWLTCQIILPLMDTFMLILLARDRIIAVAEETFEHLGRRTDLLHAIDVLGRRCLPILLVV